jgi:hypothetical protein
MRRLALRKGSELSNTWRTPPKLKRASEPERWTMGITVILLALMLAVALAAFGFVRLLTG